jgi:hypothetical protein
MHTEGIPVKMDPAEFIFVKTMVRTKAIFVRAKTRTDSIPVNVRKMFPQQVFGTKGESVEQAFVQKVCLQQ